MAHSKLDDWTPVERQELVADTLKSIFDQMQFRTLEDVLADPFRIDVPPRYVGKV